MEIDHVGYLVKDIEKAIQQFIAMGYRQISDIIVDDVLLDGQLTARNIKICFLLNESNICGQGYNVELVSPCGEISDVTGLLKRQGSGPYHICYRTNDIMKTVDEFQRRGWIITKNVAPAVAFFGAKVAFAFHANLGLIEFVER